MNDELKLPLENANIHTMKNVSTKKKKYLEKIKNNMALITMTLPAVLLIFIFSYIPMFGIIIAFKKFDLNKGILGSDWVGFKNFEFFFKSQDALIVTTNTIMLNLVFIIVGLIISVLFALLLNEITKRTFVKIYQTLMLFPHFLSWVVVGYILFSFLNMDFGIINKTLMNMGIQPIKWYNNASYWPYILTFVYIWKAVGYSSIIYYAALMGIDNEYYEAASIDGANRIQMAFKISIPFLIPLITIMTLLAIGRIIRADFGMFYYLPKDSGVLFKTTGVIDTYVFNMLKNIGDFGMASAVGLYQSIVGFLLVIGTNIIVKKVDAESSIF